MDTVSHQESQLSQFNESHVSAESNIKRYIEGPLTCYLPKLLTPDQLHRLKIWTVNHASHTWWKEKPSRPVRKQESLLTTLCQQVRAAIRSMKNRPLKLFKKVMSYAGFMTGLNNEIEQMQKVDHAVAECSISSLYVELERVEAQPLSDTTCLG